MSIIGNAVINGSSATKPYTEYTLNASGNVIKIKPIGFTKIPAEFWPASGNDSNITEIDLSQSLNITMIGDNAFRSRRGSTANGVTISLPNTVTAIGANAFYASGVIISNLPTSLTSLGTYAFYNCGKVTISTFPDGVTSLPNYCFYYPASSSLNFNNITTIGQYAFYGGSFLSSISGSKVTTINASAFQSCSSLTTVNLPVLKTLGNSVFQGCTALTTVTLSALKTIGTSAFQGCTALSSIDLPSTVTSIAASAFKSCSSLNTLYCRATTPPTLSNVSALNTADLSHIYVPSGSVSAYQSATNWSSFSSLISAIPT